MDVNFLSCLNLVVLGLVCTIDIGTELAPGG